MLLTRASRSLYEVPRAADNSRASRARNGVATRLLWVMVACHNRMIPNSRYNNNLTRPGLGCRVIYRINRFKLVITVPRRLCYGVVQLQVPTYIKGQISRLPIRLNYLTRSGRFILTRRRRHARVAQAAILTRIHQDKVMLMTVFRHLEEPRTRAAVPIRVAPSHQRRLCRIRSVFRLRATAPIGLPSLRISHRRRVTRLRLHPLRHCRRLVRFLFWLIQPRLKVMAVSSQGPIRRRCHRCRMVLLVQLHRLPRQLCVSR